MEKHLRRYKYHIRYATFGMLIVLVFLVVFVFPNRYKKSGNVKYINSANQPNQNYHRKYSTTPDIFSFNVNVSSKQQTLLTINPKSIGLYLNYHDSYSCPYYTDRADLIAPEINRFAQFCRSFGFKIIFNSLTEKSSIELISEKNGGDKDDIIDKFIKSKNIPKSPSLYLEETSPLVQDKCLFEDFDENPAYTNGTIHHDILYSTHSDLFVKEHVETVYLASENQLTHIIVGGMKCNMWLPPLFEQLKSAGIQPIYLYDLSDVVFYRATQKEKIDTHLIAVNHFWKWVNKKYKMIVNHFDLLDRYTLKKPFGANIKFDRNQNAYKFKEYFDPNFF